MGIKLNCPLHQVHIISFCCRLEYVQPYTLEPSLHTATFVSHVHHCSDADDPVSPLDREPSITYSPQNCIELVDIWSGMFLVSQKNGRQEMEARSINTQTINPIARIHLLPPSSRATPFLTTNPPKTAIITSQASNPQTHFKTITHRTQTE